MSKKVSNVGSSTCSDLCSAYQVTRPSSGNRYGNGQARCQICEIWIDYRGCHLGDGSPATDVPHIGWFCNCCNFKVRRKPRNKVYKEKLRDLLK